MDMDMAKVRLSNEEISHYQSLHLLTEEKAAELRERNKRADTTEAIR